ncbi:MAG TPA: hypothetical protein VLM75_09275 [Spirochaetota bacterium]|nr:hypothetical protein [Spirochaetota bacterium]
MFQSLRDLEATLGEFERAIGQKRVEPDDIFIRLNKYVRAVFSSGVKSNKGDALTVPLDAAFNIAIRLFRMIDAGGEGLDDRMAEEFENIRAKNLVS